MFTVCLILAGQTHEFIMSELEFNRLLREYTQRRGIVRKYQVNEPGSIKGAGYLYVRPCDILALYKNDP